MKLGSIKKRIRDIKIPSNDDKMFLMLESTLSLAILKKLRMIDLYYLKYVRYKKST